MASNGNRLPLEIWKNVIEQIQWDSQLCQCRLVCKSWNGIAERVLLANDVCLPGPLNVAKLFLYLQQKPDNAQLIKNIVIDYAKGDEPEVQLLFQLAFTTNMRTISFTYDGLVENELYDTLLDTINNSPDPSAFKLESLPNPRYEEFESYRELVHLLRNTIQAVQLPLDNECMLQFDNLRAFKQLRHLDLRSISFDTIYQLEGILKNCSNLDHLELDWETNNYTGLTPAHENCLEWATRNVQQVKTLKSLVIYATHPDLFDYLTFKYPNVESFHSYNTDCGETFYKATMKSLMKNMKCFVTNLFIYQQQQQELSNVFSYICDLDDDRPTQIKVHVGCCAVYDECDAEIRVEMEVDLVREIDLRINVKEGLTNFAYKTLVDQLGRLNSNCVIVDFNLHTAHPDSQDDELIDIWYIANQIPTLKALMVGSSSKIRHNPFFDLSRQSDCKLESLNLRAVELDTQTLSQISWQFPHLRDVSLKNCVLVNNEETEKEVYHIDMSHCSLKTVSIHIDDQYKRSEHGNAERLEAMMENLRSAHYGHVQLSLLDLNEQIYLRFGNATAVVDSERFAFWSGRRETPIIKVTCRNTDQLSIKLDKIDIKFNVAKHVSRQHIQAEAKAIGSRYESEASNMNDVEGLRSLFTAYKTEMDDLMVKVDSLRGSAWVHRNFDEKD